jgi:ribosomal protein S21
MYKRNRKNNFRNQSQEIRTCITVSHEECNGNSEKMVRRFIKKVKNSGIIDEFRDRRHYSKPSDKKREENRKRQRVIDKVNKQRETLLKSRDLRSSKPKRKHRRT